MVHLALGLIVTVGFALTLNAQGGPPRQTLICGMKVVAADPRIDPKMAKPAPRGNFTLRVLRPPVCRDQNRAWRGDPGKRLPLFLGPNP